jgi:hypothetical protein
MRLVDRKTYGYIDMLNLDLRKEISKIKIPVVILAASNPDLTTVQTPIKPSMKTYLLLKLNMQQTPLILLCMINQNGL